MSRLDFLYKLPLPHRAVALYTYLDSRADAYGVCGPAIPTIADDLKLSKSTIKRAVQDLKKAGLLTTEQRYRDSGGSSSLLFKISRPPN